MSLLRFKMLLPESDEIPLYSITNDPIENYAQDFNTEASRQNEYELELGNYDEIEYVDYKGNPLFRVLEWACTDQNAKNTSIPFGQITDMADRKRTPWHISNVSIDVYGTVCFSFDLANPENRCEEVFSSSYFIGVEDSSFFRLILETRSDGFAISRYSIVRDRFSKGVTSIRVTERTGSYIRHMEFRFPDDGEASCEVTEARR